MVDYYSIKPKEANVQNIHHWLLKNFKDTAATHSHSTFLSPAIPSFL